MRFIDIGSKGFATSYEIQKKYLNEVKDGNENITIFVEHTNVFTIGRDGSEKNILVNRDTLREKKIDVLNIDRGGDVTYHGPGQIVCYPIVNLRKSRDIHKYVRDLEDLLIITLRDFGINAGIDKDFPGVWVLNNKIAAIGIGVSHWVTYHGFALNVNTDLSYFDMIIPCGIKDRGVTSMERELNKSLDINEVKDLLKYNIKKYFE